IQIQLVRPCGLPPMNAPPTQTSPGGAVSASRQPWPTASMGAEPSPPSSNGLHRVDEPSALHTFAQQGDTVSGPCAAARLGESSSPTTAAPAAAADTRNLLILIASSFGGNQPALLCLFREFHTRTSLPLRCILHLHSCRCRHEPRSYRRTGSSGIRL